MLPAKNNSSSNNLAKGSCVALCEWMRREKSWPDLTRKRDPVGFHDPGHSTSRSRYWSEAWKLAFVSLPSSPSKTNRNAGDLARKNRGSNHLHRCRFRQSLDTTAWVLLPRSRDGGGLSSVGSSVVCACCSRDRWVIAICGRDCYLCWSLWFVKRKVRECVSVISNAD